MMSKFSFLTFFLLAVSCVFLPGNYLIAQSDSLILSNGDKIVGEIKNMSSGVVTIETDYSDSDFKIEWEKIKELYTDQLYTVVLTDKSVLTGSKVETTTPGKLKVSDEYMTREVDVNDIVYFRQLDEGFWSKVSASVDIGYSLTKANNLQQYNASANLGYQSDQWTHNASYRQVRSTQDEVDPIRRVEGAISTNYMMRNGIFFGGALNFLSNSEQSLQLRTTGTVGSGYYMVRTNSWYWNGFLGVAINNEDYEEDVTTAGSADRQSYEGVMGTELNLYDVGDLNLFTNFYWYPSFTEAGRNRIDYKIDVSYDIFEDFYIKAGLTLNYDSKPVEGSSPSDYVILTGFGWEL